MPRPPRKRSNPELRNRVESGRDEQETSPEVTRGNYRAGSSFADSALEHGKMAVNKAREISEGNPRTLDSLIGSLGGEGAMATIGAYEALKDSDTYQAMKEVLMETHHAGALTEDGVRADTDSDFASSSTGILYEFAVLAKAAGHSDLIDDFVHFTEQAPSTTVPASDSSISDEQLTSLGISRTQLGSVERIAPMVRMIAYKPRNGS